MKMKEWAWISATNQKTGKPATTNPPSPPPPPVQTDCRVYCVCVTLSLAGEQTNWNPPEHITFPSTTIASFHPLEYTYKFSTAQSPGPAFIYTWQGLKREKQNGKKRPVDDKLRQLRCGEVMTPSPVIFVMFLDLPIYTCSFLFYSFLFWKGGFLLLVLYTRRLSAFLNFIYLLHSITLAAAGAAAIFPVRLVVLFSVWNGHKDGPRFSFDFFSILFPPQMCCVIANTRSNLLSYTISWKIEGRKRDAIAPMQLAKEQSQLLHEHNSSQKVYYRPSTCVCVSTTSSVSASFTRVLTSSVISLKKREKDRKKIGNPFYTCPFGTAVHQMTG